MERARAARLTRHQHILLRIGEWTAYAESAGCLARRAALAAEGRLNEKANMRFDPAALAALSRIFAREAALKVATEGLRWVIGAGGVQEMASGFGSCVGPAGDSSGAGGVDGGYGSGGRRVVRPRGEARGSAGVGARCWTAQRDATCRRALSEG